MNRYLDRLRDHLEERGIRLEEAIDPEQFYSILHTSRQEDLPSPTSFLGCAGDESQSCGPEGWPCDPDRLIDTLEKGFHTVGVNIATLNGEIDALRRGLAEQVSTIGREIEPEYFQWILTILATGSIRAAAEALGLRKSTLADKVQRYAARGGTYAFLHGLVKVRRRVLGTRRLERYNEASLPAQGNALALDDESLLQELMGALQSQNEKNWPKVRQEILDLLAEHLG